MISEIKLQQWQDSLNRANMADRFMLERLDAINQHVKVARHLMQIWTHRGVKPIINRAWDMLPCCPDFLPADKPSPVFANEDQRLANFQRSLGTMEDRVFLELTDVLATKADDAAFEVELRTSLHLDSSDSEYDDDSDNLLVHQALPWQELFPELAGNKSGRETKRISRLYDYILNTAVPRIRETDFLRLGDIWVDILAKTTTGFKLTDKATTARRMNPEEITRLLRFYQDYQFPEFPENRIQRTAEELACDRYIEELLDLLDQLRASYASDAPKAGKLILALYSLLYGRQRKCKFWRYKAGKLHLSYGPWPKWEGFNQEHWQRMACLDGIMREIEKETTPFMEQVERDVALRNQNADTRLSDDESPLDTILTFWTFDGDLQIPVPFWENRIMGLDLFNDPDDWHETHPYSPMCYLTHVAFIDGGMPYTELEHIDYISRPLKTILSLEYWSGLNIRIK